MHAQEARYEHLLARAREGERVAKDDSDALRRALRGAEVTLRLELKTKPAHCCPAVALRLEFKTTPAHCCPAVTLRTRRTQDCARATVVLRSRISHRCLLILGLSWTAPPQEALEGHRANTSIARLGAAFGDGELRREQLEREMSALQITLTFTSARSLSSP